MAAVQDILLSEYGVGVASIAAVLLFSYLFGRVRYYYKLSNVTVAHDTGLLDRWMSMSGGKARQEFIADFRSVMKRGFAKTDLGDVIVLAPRYAEEIRDDSGLSAGEYTSIELMGFIPGMEAFSFAGTHRGLMHDVITKKLNRHLPETNRVFKELWSDQSEWHSVQLYETLLHTVAQVSTRAFLGEVMARNRRWVELNSQYTMVGLGAVMALRPWPRFLLPLIHHVHPQVRATRAILAEARAIMKTVRQDRSSDKNRVQDSLDWFDEVAVQRGDSYDPAVAQLTFSVAAMHSTTDQLCQVLIDLRDHPDVVAEIRKELVQAVELEGGWTPATFGHLRLMDSVMKESQRLKPINRVFNKRRVLKDMHLSGGVHLPKGSFIAVSANRMTDPERYADPNTFNPYRFVELAESDPEVARFCGFSSVSLDHTGFGFGKHACPGRMYVTLELKILMAFILLKYDWKFPEGYEPRLFENGFDCLTDMATAVLVRRRTEEVTLPV